MLSLIYRVRRGTQFKQIVSRQLRYVCAELDIQSEERNTIQTDFSFTRIVACFIKPPYTYSLKKEHCQYTNETTHRRLNLIR